MLLSLLKPQCCSVSKPQREQTPFQTKTVAGLPNEHVNNPGFISVFEGPKSVCVCEQSQVPNRWRQFRRRGASCTHIHFEGPFRTSAGALFSQSLGIYSFLLVAFISKDP